MSKFYIKCNIKSETNPEINVDWYWEIQQVLNYDKGFNEYTDYQYIEDINDPISPHNSISKNFVNLTTLQYDLVGEISPYSNLFNYALANEGDYIELSNGSKIVALKEIVYDRNVGLTSYKYRRMLYDFISPTGQSLRELLGQPSIDDDPRDLAYTSGFYSQISGLYEDNNVKAIWNASANNREFFGTVFALHTKYEDEINSIDTLIEAINTYKSLEDTSNFPLFFPLTLIGERESGELGDSVSALDKTFSSICAYPPFNATDSIFSYEIAYPRFSNAFSFYETLQTQNLIQFWIDFFTGAESTTDDPSDPSEDDITSGTGGGGGTWDGSSEEAGGIYLPQLQGLNLGLITAYTCDSGTIRALANKLWSTEAHEVIVNMFTQPLDSIISLQTTPIDVTGVSQNIQLGNYDTGIVANAVTTRYYERDLGSITLKEYEGSYMDYDPHTKVHLYLPFIGIQQLNVNDVMGSTISIKYAIDILTGNCVAVVKVSKNELNSYIYTYSGNCNSQLPVTSLSQGSLAGGMLAGLGTATAGLISGNPLMLVGGGLTAMASSGIINAGLGNVSRSGGLASTSGILGSRKAYLIVERQKKAYPQNYRDYQGRTSEITMSLGEVSGFTQVRNVELDGFVATDEEKDEIMSLLQEGVIL